MLDWLFTRKKPQASVTVDEVKRLSLEGIKLYRDDQLVAIRRNVCTAVANALHKAPPGDFEARASGNLKQGGARYANYLVLFSCPGDEKQAGTALVEIELVPSLQKAQFFMFIEHRKTVHLTYEAWPEDEALIYTERIRQATKLICGSDFAGIVKFTTEPGLTKVAETATNVIQFRPK